MVDIPDNDTTSATIAVGDTFADTLELAGDKDWVAVTLVAGQSYTISLSTPGATGVNDAFLSIYDAPSVLVGADDDAGPGLDSLATYTPAETGTFYIEASALSNGTGTYVIEVQEAPHPDFLDSIDWGSQMATNSINVCFAPPGEVVDGHASRGWSAYEIQQTMLALQQIANVCDVAFQITSVAGDAEFTVATDRSQNWLGYFNPPDTGADSGTGVFATNGFGWDDAPGGGLEQGGYGFITLIHEFGHGMGLAHPHDGGGSSTTWEGVTSPFDSYGTFDLNQGVYTTMSYNDGWELNPDGLPADEIFGYQGTMMAFDIAVLQEKYGVNADFHGGGDVYTLVDQNASGTFYSCLWDTGGADEIKYDGNADATIDLRAAHLGYAVGSGGYISYVSGILGGFTIANGVVIENGTGGEGDDELIGNAARNTLMGRGGGDVLMGGLGRDLLLGGNGADRFHFLTMHDSGIKQKGRDQIADFNSGSDLVDLSALDARSNGTANDAFVWINSDAFHSVKGELRWHVTANGVLIEADRNGDGTADFTLLLAGINAVIEADFTL